MVHPSGARDIRARPLPGVVALALLTPARMKANRPAGARLELSRSWIWAAPLAGWAILRALAYSYRGSDAHTA
jgi:hypothetical protein